jgi:hypothetical protein
VGIGAVAMSLIDAALLQRRESYFTGGFLRDDHLNGAGEVLAFAVVSFVTDFGLIALLAGLTLWVASRLALTVRASLLAAALVALGPLAVADIVSYELLRYVGDALDLSLAFELTGRNVDELLAVASSHLITPVLAVVAAGGIGGGAVWWVNRYAMGERAQRVPARWLAVPMFCAVVGLAVTAAAASADTSLQNGVLRKPSGTAFALLVNRVSDLDRDGYGVMGRLSDPDPFNVAVFPYALDVPGNGIDEDGVAGDLPREHPPYAEPVRQPSKWSRRPDVVLVVLESFRADLLGARLDGRPITPVLDELAARGVSSSSAYSPNGYTAQSRFHLLSGSLAGIGNGRTLIDDFKANGYFVAYFSAQDESFGGARYDVGFGRADLAFDARSDVARRYSSFTTAGSLAVPFGVLEEHINSFLQRPPDPDRPLFMYVNLHDTHFPYTHESVESILTPVRLERGDIGPARRESLWATYANTAANVDGAIGRIIAAVRERRGRSPAIIVTADHGESLYDEGFLGHGHSLNEVQTRVPLIAVDLPMTIEEPFSHVDLRGAIEAALRTESDGAPRIVPSRDRMIFQYLGNIDRPRQIAFLRDGRRTSYDFRTRRVSFGDGRWVSPGELPPAAASEWQRLVWDWESMNFARGEARGSGQ